MNSLIKKYILNITRKKNYKKNTIDAYERDLKFFAEYLSKNKIAFDEVTKLKINLYAAHLLRNGKSEATVARTLSTIKGFYSYLYEKKILNNNPSLNVTTPHIEKKKTNILSLEEMDLFLSQPDLSTPKGCRDKAILELIYATGIKVSELISLKISDVNFISETITVGNREIPYGTVCSSSLNMYIEKSEFINISDKTAYLFTNLSGTKLSRQGIWKIIKYYKMMSGIEKEITPQIMRHSFAVHLIDNGIDIKTLQELMGHTVIASTQTYIELSKRKIRSIYKSVHPRA